MDSTDKIVSASCSHGGEGNLNNDAFIRSEFGYHLPGYASHDLICRLRVFCDHTRALFNVKLVPKNPSVESHSVSRVTASFMCVFSQIIPIKT
jgi:hypothetical protein